VSVDVSTPQYNFPAQRRVVRRAWVVIVGAATILLIFALASVAAGRYYYVHATIDQEAELRVISGDGALWRSSSDEEWTLVNGSVSLSEGDQVSTALGTVVWITLFDGSTVEVAEDSILTLERMRVSRFLERTKEVVLRLERGTVYVAMAPRGVYEYAEFSATVDSTRVVMADQPGADEAGVFLVEVDAGPAGNEASNLAGTRIAVLRGAARILTPSREAVRLSDDQQILVGQNGDLGAQTRAIRELVRNGNFRDGLTGWVEFHDAADIGGSAVAGSLAILEAAEDRDQPALQFLREGDGQLLTRVGVRQPIGRTLRVFNSLTLQMDVRILEQNPPVDATATEFPLTVELHYIDVQGEQRIWARSYFVAEADAVMPPGGQASAISSDQWQHVVFEFHSLQPLPKQIDSLVVYASGYSYHVQVANISLTTGELQHPVP
jgi:hypothetical protein